MCFGNCNDGWVGWTNDLQNKEVSKGSEVQNSLHDFSIELDNLWHEYVFTIIIITMLVEQMISIIEIVLKGLEVRNSQHDFSIELDSSSHQICFCNYNDDYVDWTDDLLNRDCVKGVRGSKLSAWFFDLARQFIARNLFNMIYLFYVIY